MLLHWENWETGNQRTNFFELKKVLLIQKKFLWSLEIDLFTLKKIFLNQQNFLQFKKIISLTLYQRICFLGVNSSLRKIFHWVNRICNKVISLTQQNSLLIKLSLTQPNIELLMNFKYSLDSTRKCNQVNQILSEYKKTIWFNKQSFFLIFAAF